MDIKPAQQQILDDIKQEIAIARQYKTFENYANDCLQNVRDRESFRDIFELRLNGCVIWASSSPLHYLQNRGLVRIIKNGYAAGIDIVEVLESE